MEQMSSLGVAIQPLINGIAEAWLKDPELGHEVLASLRGAYEWRLKQNDGRQTSWSSAVKALTAMETELRKLEPGVGGASINRKELVSLLTKKIRQLSASNPETPTKPEAIALPRIYLALLVALFAQIKDEEGREVERGNLIKLGDQLSLR